MTFELSHFDGYLHFFAAANLAYAGSAPFRTALDDQILRIAKTVPSNIKTEIEKLTNKMIILRAESGYSSDAIRERIGAVTTEFSEKCTNLTAKLGGTVNASLELSKAMFLFSGFYCIALLILSGYQQFFESKISLGCSMLSLHISASYMVILFIISCFKNAPNKRISFLIPISLLILTLILAKWHCSNHSITATEDDNVLKPKANATIAVCLAFSPYFFHIIRIYVKKISFWFKFKVVDFRTKFKIDTINYIMDFTYAKTNSMGFLRPIKFVFSYLLEGVKNLFRRIFLLKSL